MKTINKCKAKVLSKQEIHGYRGRTIYTFELQLENGPIQLTKNNMHIYPNVNDILDVYPVYDEENNLIDFDYGLDVQSKISPPFFLFATGSVLTSVFLVINDKTNFTNELSNIVFGIILFIFFFSMGLFGGKRVRINKNNLIPVQGTISALRVLHHLDYHVVMTYRVNISPIYQVNIDGEIYQFLGDKHVKEEDKGKEVTVYYDKETMEFFDLPKSNGDMIFTIAMFGLATLIFLSMWTSIF